MDEPKVKKQPPIQTNPEPAQPAVQVKKPTNTLAIVGLILAIFELLLPLVGIIISIIALKQIKKKSEGGRGIAIAGIVIGCTLLFLQVAVVSASIINPHPAQHPDDKPAQTTQKTEEKPQKPAEPAKPLTTQDKLWQAVDTGLKTRDKINVSYDATSKVALIEHTDEDPYNAEGFVRQAYTILVLFGQEAFKIDGVDKINIQNKTTFTDQYGKKSVESGVVIEMNKDQFAKFDWKNLEYQEVATRIQAASGIYIIKPALQKEINDPKKLYLKLSY